MVGTGHRLTYARGVVDTSSLDVNTWPANSRSFVASLHDLRHYRGILNNEANFAADGESSLQVLEIADNQHNEVFTTYNSDGEISDYLQRISVSQQQPRYRIVVCDSRKVAKTVGASFQHRVSLSSNIVRQLMSSLEISPAFLSKLVGEPDYWAPGLFGDEQTEGLLHFYCQHPRWNIHKSQTALSVYMTYNVSTACATYIIVGDTSNESSHSPSTPDLQSIINKRLMDYVQTCTVSQAKMGRGQRVADPLMLHCLIADASLTYAKPLFDKLRGRLYDVLDQVDKFAKGGFEELTDKREILANATVELSAVSQDIDSTIGSLEMAQSIALHLQEADSEILKFTAPGGFDLVTPTTTPVRTTGPGTRPIVYLKESVGRQISWLRTWKSRKDIAMNLVFNLVTQQDAASAAATAQAAQADGSSMKAIAALTMIFLPATFLAAFFGIQEFHVADMAVYWKIVVPLTALIFLAWLLWESHTKIRGFFLRRYKKAGGREQQKASGKVGAETDLEAQLPSASTTSRNPKGVRVETLELSTIATTTTSSA